MNRIGQLVTLLALIALASSIILSAVQASMPDPYSAQAHHKARQQDIEDCLEFNLNPSTDYDWHRVLTVHSMCASNPNYVMPNREALWNDGIE